MSIIQRALEKSNASKRSGDHSESGAESVSNIEKLTDDLSYNAIPSEVVEHSERVEIDFNALEAQGFLNPFAPAIGLSEQYRYIKRPILTNAFPEVDNGIKNRNLVLVTSSLPKEGKTYSSLNLALSMSMEKGKNVLLIDGDVAAPSIDRILGIKKHPGLIELLDGKVKNINQILLKTNLPGFSVITSGTPHRYSTELLASNAMKRLAHELSTRYSDRVVIIDSPPVLAASQASVLAGLVGQVVMVVESEQTPQTVVMDAMQKIENCDVIGLLLNKTVSGRGSGSYYYGSYDG